MRATGIYDERRYVGNGSLAAAVPEKPAGPSRGRLAERAKARDSSGMVDCPCGITHDDGQAMIECERCKVGAAKLCWWRPSAKSRWKACCH